MHQDLNDNRRSDEAEQTSEVSEKPEEQSISVKNSSEPAVSGILPAPDLGSASAAFASVSSGAGRAAELSDTRIPFTKKEGIFAWLFLIVGYLGLRWGFSSFWTPGLGMTIFALIYIGCLISYAVLQRAQFNLQTGAGLIWMMLFGLAPILTDNNFLKFLAVLLEIFLAAHVCGTMFHPKGIRFRGELVMKTVLGSLFVRAFSGFADLFPALGWGRRHSKAGKTVLYILIGLLAALLPSWLVLLLLTEADIAFKVVSERLFGSAVRQLSDWLPVMILSVPFTMYLFGMLSSAYRRRTDPDSSFMRARAHGHAVQVLPAALVAAAVAPLLFIYLLFFVSQAAYYTMAFRRLLPEGFTYASYARKGFFELCTVASINAVAALIMARYARHRRDGRPMLLCQILSTLLSVFTLALIATAFRKMFLYMEVFGPTQLRVYTSWFMLLLSFGFLLHLLCTWVPKISFSTFFCHGFLVLLALLVLSDSDALIARYHVERHLTGEQELIDVNMLGNLSDGAVPYLLRLCEESSSETVRREAENALLDRARSLCMMPSVWREWNIPSSRAAVLLASRGYIARVETEKSASLSQSESENEKENREENKENFFDDTEQLKKENVIAGA